MSNPKSDKIEQKKEDAESFSCSSSSSSISSSSVSSTSTGATAHAVVDEIFDKKSSSPPAAPTATASQQTNVTDTKNLEFSEDSGFISGPQPTTIDEEISNVELIPGPKSDDKKFQNKQSTEEKTALDSGCIDECVEEEEEEEEEEGVNENNQRAAALDTNTNKPAPMLLEKGVDAGISEWFCKINLNDQHPINPDGSSMNNLGAPKAGSRNKKQKSSSSSTPSPPKEEKTDSVPKAKYSDAWEKFFQQNEDGDTPLHLACISGYLDIIAMLIRMAPHPCLLNIQNDAVQTALHLAAITGQPKILRMLIIAGAESCIRDHRGNTALHLACMSGDLQCVKALTIPISSSELNESYRWNKHRTMSTEMKDNLELRNYDGERCVHIAAYKGHVDVLRHLISYGVDINAKEGKSGRTALHIAIETCNDTLATFLLEECSNINLETETYAGLTAYQFACILENSKMQNFLEKFGAELLTPPDSDYDSSDIEGDLDDSQIYDRFGDSNYFANYNGGNVMTVA